MLRVTGSVPQALAAAVAAVVAFGPVEGPAVGAVLAEGPQALTAIRSEAPIARLLPRCFMFPPHGRHADSARARSRCRCASSVRGVRWSAAIATGWARPARVRCRSAWPASEAERPRRGDLGLAG